MDDKDIQTTQRINPLLTTPDTPFSTPQFDAIRTEDYEPAIAEALASARNTIEAIALAPASFEGTIAALERSTSRADDIANIFFALHEVAASDDMDAAAERIQARLVEFANDTYLDPRLFAKVKEVYDSRNSLELDAEQSMLLERTYKSFVRGGAGLGPQDKARYREITASLASLSLRFGQNVLAATNSFALDIPASQAETVAELPATVRDGMAAEAKACGLNGWRVTLHAASYLPFMTYSSDRTLKERLWRAYNTRGAGADNDNRDIIRQITSLRLELARMLGYGCYADYVLEERMAGDTATVERFMSELLSATVDRAADEVATLQRYAAETLYDDHFELMPWDWNYVGECYRQKAYAVGDEEIKPYLELGRALQGVFMLAEKLYGIRFTRNDTIPVYHPDVSAYEVHEADGRFLGILYTDFFPRSDKRSGAWMTEYRAMRTEADGTEIRPFVTLCCNFPKPTDSTPSLLTFRELETLLHEFGHCLHGLFAEGRYASLTGTSVYRDFVELPSQIMENWASKREFLDLFAIHYITGEKMPQELIDKIVRSKNYLAAYSNVRQLGFAMNDMAWHTLSAPVTVDIEDFETAAMAPSQVLPHVKGTAMSTSFSHIFDGGYAAGYYGYKWAEVLEADAFALFEEKGIFNREVAASFRRNILSRGGSEHPMILYTRFRGHKPATQALIDKILGSGH